MSALPAESGEDRELIDQYVDELKGQLRLFSRIVRDVVEAFAGIIGRGDVVKTIEHADALLASDPRDAARRARRERQTDPAPPPVMDGEFEEVGEEQRGSVMDGIEIPGPPRVPTILPLIEDESREAFQ